MIAYREDVDLRQQVIEHLFDDTLRQTSTHSC
jgi:hypothetical protein